MANKKRLFKDKPRGDSYGQYTFLESNQNTEYENSDSLPVVWDKFLDRDLYTISEDNIVNLNIVNSMISEYDTDQDYLKYNQDTFIRFDELVLTRRPNIQYGIKDVDTRIYMFSAYAVSENGLHDDREFRTPYKVVDGFETQELKSWNEYRNDLWRTTGDPDAWPADTDNHRDPGEIAILLNKRLSGVSQEGEGTGLVPEFDTYVAVTNLTNQSPSYPTWDDINVGGNFYTTTTDAQENHHNIASDTIPAEDHLSAFMVRPPLVEEDDDGGEEEEEDVPGFDEDEEGTVTPIPDLQPVPGTPRRKDNPQSISPGIRPAPYPGGIVGIGRGNPATQTRNRLTEIFQEDGQYNPIYIVISHRGDASVPGPSNDFARNDRIQTFKINQNDLFTFDDVGNVFGKETTFEFGENDSLIMDESGQSAVAQTVTSLKVTINTFGYGGSLNIPEEYQEYLSQVTAPKVPIDLENLDERFLDIRPTNEIFFTNQTNLAFDINEFTDWTPFSTITLVDNQHDLQVYYDDLNDKLKSSAPNTIQLDFEVATDKEDIPEEGELIDRNSSLPAGVNIGYAYYVLSWDDVDNEYDTWNNVTADHPTLFSRLLSKQEENLYKIGIVNKKSLKHSYGSPGIKTIKAVMFNYQINEDNPNLAEPIRWKLITVRHFLDIPRNEYPEFGELGGDDYITIPWPYTSAVIGGVSENSKYTKSIEKTLSGGKIVEEDIIDETFLIDAQNNTELGKNVEQMDLEQFRFFNSPFDMHELLGIKDSIANTFIDPDSPYDVTPEYLATLPFPQYLEELEIDGIEPMNILDAVQWGQVEAGRVDIQCAVVASVLGGIAGGEHLETGEIEGSEYNCGDFTYPSYVYNWPYEGIPSGNGAEQPVETFLNVQLFVNLFYPYTSGSYWNGNSNTGSFSQESSVGQIFINDNLDFNIKDKCQIEYNTGNINNKSIYDSSGHGNQGLLIGDYKIKKRRQAEPMSRDTFIKFPKKDSKDGAL
jgi:hypothetical protein